MTYSECVRCGAQVAFYSEGALRGFQAENARREAAGREPFPSICEPCRRLDRQPQGESMRLFTPAPNQIPGQLGL
jgi:hypothetical protein